MAHAYILHKNAATSIRAPNQTSIRVCTNPKRWRSRLRAARPLGRLAFRSGRHDASWIQNRCNGANCISCSNTRRNLVLCAEGTNTSGSRTADPRAYEAWRAGQAALLDSAKSCVPHCIPSPSPRAFSSQRGCLQLCCCALPPPAVESAQKAAS